MHSEHNSRELQGQVAIVTGASAGLGRATALALAAVGMRLVLTARREQRLLALQQEIRKAGGEAVVVAGDAAQEATAVAAVNAALTAFGRIDVLINNAGAGLYKSLVHTTADEYDELLRSNLRSSFLFARHTAPEFIQQRSGTMIFVSSVAGLAGAANESVYAATKFAQVGFAQSLAEELRGYGVKVTALCPGGMKTEFAIGRGRTTEQVESSRMMDASAVAETILFVCRQPINARLTQLTVRHMGEPFA
ncbi:SDR family oxidoreductase [Acidipila sp. EB88]|uniref:SDR family oxidoreductase n=1 Tax=Acidipila sp. EB88 TaxID=2305226 RepID=UPI000F5EADF9|nr:SDR family oxidoreductase [Acidipila sp. EB88]RRA50189.1 SDR family oxidoreductase [Acidipila sp. EB88]